MNKPELSIIVPALNEAQNLPLLLQRIDRTLSGRIYYEVLIVDDHSTDNTSYVVSELSWQYPFLRFFRKNGKRGKAYSLLQGFSSAEASVLAYIDADLQYPPEALLPMYEQIIQGRDIVIGKRTREEKKIRALSSFIFSRLFGKALHGLPYDVQSGQKMFRREIIERINIQPTGWTFDLEFLLKAKAAGYSIIDIPVKFSKRENGKSKINLLSGTIEIAWEAIKMKFTDIGIIPFHSKRIKERGQGFHYKSKEFVSYTDISNSESAFKSITTVQWFGFFLIVLTITLGILINWESTLVIIVATLTILYFGDLLFNLFVILRSFIIEPEIKVTDEEIAAFPVEAWPKYTVFCPLYKEWSVVPQFVKAMEGLDYPENKLQVILLLEEDDKETIEHIQQEYLPKYFEIKIIPHSLPKTKPKALNFGLGYAQGDYIVIYDAEDIPDSNQLKKAVLAFHKAGKKTICIQAKLNFYNPHQNLLTRAFTAEYSLWFDLVLTGLQSVGAPIPLGGTSNHFKKVDLTKLKGWDPFNVTEDCDLGMRLAKKGYKTAIVDSVTFEEANSDLLNWFNQRTRWIKGYIQTYLVHTRNMRGFFRSWKEPHFISFQFIVGGKVASMFINPIMWVITASYFIFRPIIGETIEKFYPSPILYMGIACLLGGNFLYLFYYMVGCAKREYYSLVKYTVFVPFYWLMMSFAAWKALFQIFFSPHYWAKTKHGLHLKHEAKVKQTNEYKIDKIALELNPIR